jgi:uncharacterized DUF497 family protein
VITFAQNEITKHNISIQEVLEALNYQIGIFDLPVSNTGNSRYMILGFTANARLLEIGLEDINKDTEHVFHAMDATQFYRNQI